MECGLPVRAPGSRARHVEIFSKLLLSMGEVFSSFPSDSLWGLGMSVVSPCGDLLELNEEHFQITHVFIPYLLFSMSGYGTWVMYF